MVNTSLQIAYGKIALKEQTCCTPFLSIKLVGGLKDTKPRKSSGSMKPIAQAEEAGRGGGGGKPSAPLDICIKKFKICNRRGQEMRVKN